MRLPAGRGLLRAEGGKVNLKRVLRLWPEEGLKVRRKRRRLGSSEGGTQRRRAARGNEVWSYDFVLDRTADGRPLKVLPVVDEHTRECLALVMGRSLTAADVVETLARIVESGAYPRTCGATTGRSSSRRRR